MRREHVRLAIMTNAKPEVLARAVASARHMIDSACIVIAPRAYHCLPSEGFGYMCLETKVMQVPWKGFAATRTELLRRAEEDEEVDWVLMMDADDVFLPDARFPAEHERCDVDSFDIPVELRGPGYRWRWYRHGHMMRARKGFSWVGTGKSDRHEVLVYPPGTRCKRFDGASLVNVFDPDATTEPVERRDWNTDVASFEEMPSEPRALFYYAQSLKDAGRTEDAFRAFERRASMAGAVEETFWALLWMGKLAAPVERDPVPYLMAAHKHSPHRAEPLYALSAYHRRRNENALANGYGKMAHACPYPKDAASFVEVHAYHPNALRAAGIQP